MAWDVALGICRLWPEEIHDLRKFADWRLGGEVDEESKEALDDLMYFNKATYDGGNLKVKYAADDRKELAPGIKDGPQKELVYQAPHNGGSR